MGTRELSAREEQIVELCVEGLTNEAIALRLGLSVGTVNSYWLRIKLKVGGSGRTNTVVKVIKEQAERALRETNVDCNQVAGVVAEKRDEALELCAALALLRLTIAQTSLTVWATDKDLAIHILANGTAPSDHFGVKWEVGRTIYEIFKTDDPANPAVAAHFTAIQGLETEARLEGEFHNMVLRVMPLFYEAGGVMGCIGILRDAG